MKYLGITCTDGEIYKIPDCTLEVLKDTMRNANVIEYKDEVNRDNLIFTSQIIHVVEKESY